MASSFVPFLTSRSIKNGQESRSTSRQTLESLLFPSVRVTEEVAVERLKVALTSKAWEDALDVLSSNPEAAKVKSAQGRTPLISALMNKANIEVVEALLAAWPDAVKERDGQGHFSGGWTPLRVAISFRAPMEIVMPILSAWPEAAHEKDEYGAYGQDKEGRSLLLFTLDNRAS